MVKNGEKMEWETLTQLQGKSHHVKIVQNVIQLAGVDAKNTKHGNHGWTK